MRFFAKSFGIEFNVAGEGYGVIECDIVDFSDADGMFDCQTE